MRPDVTRPAGRPRNPELDGAILAAAEQQLREAGDAGMSLESVAAAARTTVPAVRRRFRNKASVAVAVIDSLRVESMPAGSGPPRSRALAVLRNFRAYLLRRNSMAVVGTLLAERTVTRNCSPPSATAWSSRAGQRCAGSWPRASAAGNCRTRPTLTSSPAC